MADASVLNSEWSLLHGGGVGAVIRPIPGELTLPYACRCSSVFVSRKQNTALRWGFIFLVGKGSHLCKATELHRTSSSSRGTKCVLPHNQPIATGLHFQF